MNTIVTLILLCYLFNTFSALYNPFSIENQGQYYKSKYSEKKKLTVVSLNTIDNSSFSLNIGKKEISNFSLVGINDNLRVQIYPIVYNPQLIKVKKSVIIKALCEFSYPITVVAGNDKYQCSFSYKDKSGQQHTIGSCKLTLQYKSSICLVFGSVNIEHLSNSSQVVVSAIIYHCNSQCIRNNNLNWRSVVNSSLVFPLVSRNHIVWMKTFSKPSLHIGVLIGVPKNPINKSTVFEIPVKLTRNQSNEKISALQLQILYNKQVSIDEVISLSCFPNIDSKGYDELESLITEIEVKRDETDQCSNDDRDFLFILQMSAKEDATQLNISITVESIGYTNKPNIYNVSLDRNNELSAVVIPLFQGRNTIVPVMNNPIILPTLSKLNNPYEFNKSDLRIYYIYDEIHFTDVSTKVQCRPFDSFRLKCPSNMLKLTPMLTSIWNPDSVQWSLELMVDGLLLVLSVDPLVRPDDQWILMFPDSVLNLVSGWQAITRSKDSSLVTEAKCEPIYQVAEIQIYKKMFFHDVESNRSMEMIMDLSDKVDLNNIKLSENFAYIYKSDKSLMIRGIRYGNLVVELLTDDHKTLQKSFMTVYNDPVTVIDLEVSCIFDIHVLNKVLLSSPSIVVNELQFQYRTHNLSGDCFLIIDIIFSDKSRTNIISFPREHYSLRFITNTKIKEIYDFQDMWYNYEKFNKEDSFHVELQESNFCSNPQTVFRKLIQLNMPRKRVSIPANITTKYFITTNASGISSVVSARSAIPGMKTDNVNAKYLKTITYILITVVSVVLLIILINIIVRYCKGNKSRAYRSCRRKSLNGIDINNILPNDKDYPPLLPPPGPQVQLSDSSSVTISSPHSFWCLDPKKAKRSTSTNPFVRQSSLPVKGCSSRGFNEIAPCPPLRWANKMVPTCPTDNSYNSQDGLNSALTHDMLSCSPMTWSVTNMDIEESSGVGSLNTNIDDLIKDPYGSRERFHKLSELACSHSGKKEHIYDMV